eukprot:TRINITY_DN100933_c0_g1_i1.p1 TRINITY_DN100933_c0_g1~~TRINITY_DN100933_c0_g1_i1.p1  ORF type:complete len:384 (+),score=46.35 TRINITY_DN100933_c0_g1_i1:31-1152(+)
MDSPKPLKILALHGFGGTFGNDEHCDAFTTRMQNALHNSLQGREVSIRAPLAPNRVFDAYPAWLAGDQAPLGLVAGFAHSDTYTKGDNSIMPPKLDATNYPDVFGPAVCEAAAERIRNCLRARRLQTQSGANAPLDSPDEEGLESPAVALEWRGSEGCEASLQLLQAVWSTEGPFDGVLAFSQGCLTALLFVAKLQHQLQMERLRQRLPPQTTADALRNTDEDLCLGSASEGVQVHMNAEEASARPCGEDCSETTYLPKFLVLVGSVGIRPWPAEVAEFYPAHISAKVPILNVIGTEDRSCAPCRSREVQLLQPPASTTASYWEHQHHLKGTAPHGAHLVPDTKAFYLALSSFISWSLRRCDKSAQKTDDSAG